MVLTRDICDEIKTAVNQAVSNTIKNGSFINEITQKVIEAVTTLLEDKLINIEKSVAELKRDNEKLENKILELQNNRIVFDYNNPRFEELDRMEQTARSCHLRIFNVKEKTLEDIKQEVKNICEKVSVKVADDDIQLCYRVGKNQKDKNRGIFVKLKDVTIKQRIYGNKKFLKGTGITIKEDLTQIRLNLMKRAVDKYGIHNVWTTNGKIFVSLHNKVHSIKNEKDLLDLKM